MNGSPYFVIISFDCNCGKTLIAPVGAASRIARCGYCDTRLTVPAPSHENIRFSDNVTNCTFEQFANIALQLSQLLRFDLDQQTIRDACRWLSTIQSLIGHKNYKQQQNEIDETSAFALASVSNANSQMAYVNAEKQSEITDEYLEEQEPESFRRPTEPHQLESVFRALMQHFVQKRK